MGTLIKLIVFVKTTMLAIRLKRVGRKGQPLYRVVISDKTRDMYGDHLEILGTYNPHNKVANLKADRINYWLSVGATSSATVHNLLVKEKVINSKKVKAVAISSRRQKVLAAKKAEVKPESKEAEATA